MITLLDHLNTLKRDALDWKADKLYLGATSPDQKQDAVQQIADMLICVRGDIKRDAAAEEIIKRLKIKPGWLKGAIANRLDTDEDKNLSGTVHKLPDWANKDRVYNCNLDWRENEKEHTGYYFTGTGGSLLQLTNFVLEPLFHIYDRTGGNRRLARLHNAQSPDKFIELPTKAFISLDKFEETLGDEGYYYTREGFTKSHLKRLFGAIGNKFPTAIELKFLGWQQEGFWAYNDAIFSPMSSRGTRDPSSVGMTNASEQPTGNGQQETGNTLTRFNPIGIAKFRNTYYYSPSSSNIFKSDRKDEEGREVMDNDPYENDKFLHYQQSPVSFEQWSQHMVKMHGDNAMPLVAYAFISLFKDIVVSYEKCPLLYGYGLVQAGKSTWAECLYYLFFDKKSKPYNLSQGTVFAFFNIFERFRNCPQLFNEFDEENMAHEEYFRAFKAFYDGEGREKGMGIKGKTETQKMNSTAIVIGQTLTTKDGASVLIRSVPVKFDDPGERTDEETRNYQTWNAWTEKGMNSCIVEVLQHRAHFKEHFFKTYNTELTKLKTTIREAGEPMKERIAKNYCIFLASCKVMMGEADMSSRGTRDMDSSSVGMTAEELSSRGTRDPSSVGMTTAPGQPVTGNREPSLSLGFTYDRLFAWARTNIVNLSRMISEVDNLATFWKTVEFLLERGDLTEGEDFRIATETRIVKSVHKEDFTINFDTPTEVLYFRLVKSFPLFQREFRATTGNKPINERTLITYFESNKAYLGNNKGSRFNKSNTSSYMFDYRKLGINLERGNAASPDKRRLVELKAEVSKPSEEMPLPDNSTKLVFSTVHIESQKVPGLPDKTTYVYTKCFTGLLQYHDQLKSGAKLRLKGMLDEKPGKDGGTFRTMDVTEIEILTNGALNTAPAMFKEDPFPN